jgi:hypothetical protein
MANEKLKELKVAILVDDGFEQVELVAGRSAERTRRRGKRRETRGGKAWNDVGLVPPNARSR